MTDVTHNHLLGRNHSDVQHLLIGSQPLRLPPRDIHLFFPNLESIKITRAELTEITSEDLKGLPLLKQLILHENRLQSIESDLFKHNSALTGLSIWGNQIKHVGHNVFDRLHGLSSFYFRNNTCMNPLNIDDDRAAVELLIFNLVRNCPATIEMTETRIVNGIEFQVQAERKIAEKLEPTEERLNRLERRLDLLEGRADL